MTTEQTAAQKLLQTYRHEKKNLRHINEKIQTLRSRINSTTTTLKDVQVMGTTADKSELICVLADLSKLYELEKLSNQEFMLLIENNLASMENSLSRRILRNYYLYNHRFEQIALCENLCYRSVLRFHQKALGEYYDMFLKNCHIVSHYF